MSVTPLDNASGNASSNSEVSLDIALAQKVIFKKSDEINNNEMQIVSGYNFNNGIDYEKLFLSYLTTGFQATNLAIAIKLINEMINERNKPVNISKEIDPYFSYPSNRLRRSLTIFFGFTSNMVTSGLREIFCYLLQHNQIDCVVTSAGAIEEDLIKCLKPTFLGSFKMSGSKLREKGLNRAGNLIIPNENYCMFEKWLTPILNQCLIEQQCLVNPIFWTPSKLIHRLGKEINNKESLCYWAYKNQIPIFCPALTDGSLGDILYFHSVSNSPGIRLDIVEDLRHINTIAVKSFKSGAIILGGGFVKHHINNANLMRNGSDYAVYVNTGQEFDGSDSGADLDEAISWGKIKSSSGAVKVVADATLVFPIIVANTFAKQFTKQ